MKRYIHLLFIICFSNVLFGQWDYSKQILINSPYDSVYNGFQLRLELNTADLINQGKLNLNCSDLRFSEDCSFDEFLSYWIEEGVNTTNTIVWVKLNKLKKIGEITQINMLYGNPSAPVSSNFNETFPKALILDGNHKQIEAELSPRNPFINQKLPSNNDTIVHGVDSLKNKVFPNDTWILDADWFEIKEGFSMNSSDQYWRDYYVDVPIDSIIHKLIIQSRVVKINGELNGNEGGLAGGWFHPPLPRRARNGVDPGKGFGPGGGILPSLDYNYTPPNYYLDGWSAGGGSYGGFSGHGTYFGNTPKYVHPFSGTPYGSESDYTIFPGSGGSHGADVNDADENLQSGNYPGGNGGMAFHIESYSIHMGANGSILSNGGDGEQLPRLESPAYLAGGGGSGGGILISVEELNTEFGAQIQANGGRGGIGTVASGGGSGGRVKYFYSQMNDLPETFATGGQAPRVSPNFLILQQAPPQDGDDGTIYSSNIRPVKTEPEISFSEEFNIKVQLENSLNITENCPTHTIPFNSLPDNFSFNFTQVDFDSVQVNDTSNYPKIFGIGVPSSNSVFVKKEHNSTCITFSDTINLELLEAGEIEIPDVPILCTSGSEVQLEAPISGGEWLGPGVSKTGLFNPSLLNKGIYRITYITESSIGEACSSIGTVSIVIEVPNADFDFPSEICQNQGSVLIDPANESAIFSVSNQELEGHFIQSNQFPLGQNELKSFVEDEFGCTNSLTKRFNILIPPTISAQPDVIEFCPENEAIINLVGGISYSTTSDIEQVNSNESSLTVLVPNTQQIKVIGLGQNGCFDTIPVQLQRIEPKPVQINGADAICFGEELKLTASNGVEYSWSPVELVSNSTSKSTNLISNQDVVVSLEIIDENGCKNSTSRPFKVINKTVQVVNSLPSEICEGEFIELFFQEAFDFTFTNVDSVIRVSPTKYNIQPSKSGAIKINAEIEGCSAEPYFHFIQVNPIPKLIVEDVYSFCQNEEGYIRFKNPIAIENIQVNPSITQLSKVEFLAITSNIGVQNYTITASSNKGCTFEEPIEFKVGVNLPPEAIITSPDELTICSNEQIIAQAQAQGQGYNYIWKFNGIEISNQSFVQFYPSQSGELALTVVGGDNCNADTSTQLIVNQSPAISVNGLRKACLGNVIQLEGFGAEVFKWEVENQLVSNAKQFDYELNLESQEVLLTAYSEENCSTEETILLEAFPEPNWDIPSDTVVCKFDTVSFSIQHSNLSSIEFEFEEVIKNNDLLFEGITTNKNISVKVETFNGCIDGTNFQITVNELPQFQLLSPDTACSNDITIAQVVTDPSFQVFWETGENSQQIEYSANANSLYENRVRIQDQLGCQTSSSFTTFFQAYPRMLTIDTTVCFEESFFQSISSDQPIEKISAVVNGNTSNSNPFLIEEEIEGVVTIEIENPQGCITSDQFEIIRFPEIVNNTVSEIQLCPETTESVEVNINTEISSIEILSGAASVSNFDILVQDQIGEIKYRVSDQFNCTIEDVIDVQLFEQPKISQIELISGFCPNQDTVIDFSTQFTNSINWSTNELNGVDNSIEIYSDLEVLDLEINLYNNDGCINNYFYSIPVHFIPDVELAGNLNWCVNTNNSLQFKSYTLFDKVSWNIQSNQIGLGEFIMISDLQADEYQLQVNSITKDQCRVETIFPIQVYELPNVQFKKDTFRREVNQAGLLELSGAEGYELSSTLNIKATSQTNRFQYFESFYPEQNELFREFQVIAIGTDEFGCQNTDTAIVHIETFDWVSISNAISANQDGKNETLKILPLAGFTLNRLAIYNRWGQKVYDTNSVFNFDARDSDGNLLPEAAYVGVLEGKDRTGKAIQKQFSLTILH